MPFFPFFIWEQVETQERERPVYERSVSTATRKQVKMGATAKEIERDIEIERLSKTGEHSWHGTHA